MIRRIKLSAIEVERLCVEQVWGGSGGDQELSCGHGASLQGQTSRRQVAMEKYGVHRTSLERYTRKSLA